MKALILLIMTVALSAQAAPTKKKAQKSQSNLSTEHVFDGSSIEGRYKYADETAAVVENEKNVDDLLGVRLNFQDRRQQEQQRK